jgi:hypothetical protein
MNIYQNQSVKDMKESEMKGVLFVNVQTIIVFVV